MTATKKEKILKMKVDETDKKGDDDTHARRNYFSPPTLK